MQACLSYSSVPGCDEYMLQGDLSTCLDVARAAGHLDVVKYLEETMLCEYLDERAFLV